MREAAADLAARTKLPPDRIVIGGRSMGGRIGSMVVADARRPAPGARARAARLSAAPAGQAHTTARRALPRIRVPCLFVSGTRDAFGSPEELRDAREQIKGTVTWHWIESADHGFKPLKASGLSAAAALEAAAAAVVTFVAGC